MEEQIENVQRLFQGSVFEHDQLFDDMGQRPEGSEEHEYRKNDQNGVGYLIKKGQDTLLGSVGCHQL